MSHVAKFLSAVFWGLHCHQTGYCFEG